MNGLQKSGQITFYNDATSLEIGVLPFIFTAYILTSNNTTYTMTGININLIYTPSAAGSKGVGKATILNLGVNLNF